MRTTSIAIVGGLVVAVVAITAAETPAQHVPASTGHMPSNGVCDSNDDCVSGTSCVDNGSGVDVCTPMCAKAADCGASTACSPLVDDAGSAYGERICAAAARTLVTLTPVKESHTATPPVAWWRVGMHPSFHPVVRAKIAFAVPAIRDLAVAKILPDVQAAVASKLTSVDLVTARFSSFAPSIDALTFADIGRTDQLGVTLTGHVSAARETREVELHGWHKPSSTWKSDGTADVARFEVKLTASIAVATLVEHGGLADQQIELSITPVSNTLTIDLSVLHATLANVIPISTPPKLTFPLKDVAAQLPSYAQHFAIRWVRVASVGETEVVFDVRAD